jgi:Ca2+-binding RTX toxin-like protein
LFNDGSVPVDSNDRIMYNSGTGALSYDADGGFGPTKAIVFAKLKPGLDLTAEHFFVV